MTAKKFTAAQVDQLRVRFAEYRDKYQAIPGELRSIELVLQDIEECPELAAEFFDGRARSTLNNALLRFSAGIRSQDKTLDVLDRFLSLKEAQPSDTFEEDDEEGPAVYGFMANGSVGARRVFDRIADGLYYAPNLYYPDRDIQLKFTCDREDMVIRVEEYAHKEDIRQNKDGRWTNHGPVKSVRRGYGFLSTQRYLLHIFVTGNSPRDRVHYIEVDGCVSDGHPYLMRIGGSNPERPATYPKNDMLPVFSVFHFTSNEKTQVEINEALRSPRDPRPDPLLGFQGSGRNLTWGAVPEGRRNRPNALEEDLIEAVKANSFKGTQDALQKNADPNYQDEEGMTALHHAAALNSRTSLRMLIACGRCDYLIPDNRNRYPSDLAIEWSRDFAVARLLTRKRLQQAHAEGVEPRRVWRFK